MKRKVFMLFIMVLTAALLLQLLFSINQHSPKLYVNETWETLKMEKDLCYNLAGEWIRAETPDGKVTYSLRFQVEDPSDLYIFLAMAGSTLYINGERIEKPDKSFLIWPLAWSASADQFYTVTLSPPSAIRKNIVPYFVFIGSLPQITVFSYHNFYLSFIVLGITLLGVCYSIGLYLVKRTEKYLLILALFCLWCFLVSFGKISSDFYGSGSFTLSRLPRVIASEFKYEYANNIYRKVVTAIVCSYLFGIFIPVRIGRLNYAWYLLAAALIPLPFVSEGNFRIITYAYLPMLISVVETYAVLHGIGSADRVTETIFVVGSSAASAFRLFMAACDFEFCAHGVVDVFYKNYSVIHIIYIVMFVIVISRKYAQRFAETEKLSGELQVIRNGLEETVRVRTQDLENSYMQLKTQKEQSEAFLSAVLHNIKTPLFSLMGHCDMLALENEPAAKRGYLNTIHNNIHYVKDMVDNLSTASHMERDRALLNPRPFDLQSMMRDVESITLGRTRFIETQIDFCMPQESLCVIGDPFYLQQALQNIIDNGLRHCNGQGRVLVECRHTNEEICVLISDTGNGIDPEDIPYIFERYYTKHSGTRSMGLGLTIAREIIEKHRGHIELESNPGEGSVFTVSLPLAKEGAV